MQQETSIKSCIETVKEIENEAVSAIASLHNELDMLYKKANEVKDSILNCCALNNNSTIFSVKKVVFSPWVKSRDGVTELAPIMSDCIDRIQKSGHLILHS